MEKCDFASFILFFFLPSRDHIDNSSDIKLRGLSASTLTDEMINLFPFSSELKTLNNGNNTKRREKKIVKISCRRLMDCSELSLQNNSAELFRYNPNYSAELFCRIILLISRIIRPNSSAKLFFAELFGRIFLLIREIFLLNFSAKLLFT